VIELMEVWYKANKAYPDVLVVYRDSVANNQFAEVICK